MEEIITECWNRGLTEDDCFNYLRNYSLFTEKWKTVQMICEVYNDLEEQKKRHIEDVSLFLLEQQI